MYVLDSINSNISPRFSCVSHPIDIFTVAITNIRNMQAFSTNQIVDILHFNDKAHYLRCLLSESQNVDSL